MYKTVTYHQIKLSPFSYGTQISILVSFSIKNVHGLCNLYQGLFLPMGFAANKATAESHNKTQKFLHRYAALTLITHM